MFRTFLSLFTISENADIIDPTIRLETNKEQPEEVNQEKFSIYEPCIPYFQEKYKLKDNYFIYLFILTKLHEMLVMNQY